jgi:hypothetical protein
MSEFKDEYPEGHEAGILWERKRIIFIVIEMMKKYPHKDYSPTEVIDLVNGVDFNQNNQTTSTYKGWD